MEILTYVLSGTVEHQDSMGNKEQIQAGEFQIMSAGTGVRHSEYNGNNDRPLHLYQIWIIPDRVGLEPRYEQRMFDAPQGRQLVLSPDARDGSLKVFQDMTLSRWALKQDEQAECPIEAGRRVWIRSRCGMKLRCRFMPMKTVKSCCSICRRSDKAVNTEGSHSEPFLRRDVR